jgi:hypothetical protein
MRRGHVAGRLSHLCFRGMLPPGTKMSSTSRSPSASPDATRRRLGLAIALGCLVALTSSCRQIVGIGSGGRSADGGDAADVAADRGDSALPDGVGDGADATLVGGLPIGGATAACAPCVMLKCLDVATACAADEGCAHLDSCMWSCADGDLPCRQAWVSDPAMRIDETGYYLAGISNCVAKWCSAECLHGPWDCLGHVKWTFPTSLPSNITITTSVSDNATSSPLQGATVQLCAANDPSCDAPIGVARPSGMDGVAVMMIETSGQPFPSPMFLDIRESGYLDYIYMLDAPPIFADLDVWIDLETASAMNSVAQGLGVVYDPMRSVVRGLVHDCSGEDVPSTDIQLEMEVAGDGETALAFTSDYGEFLVVNVIAPRGQDGFFALLRSAGRVVSQDTFVTRPGALTRVVLVPRP